ncbi:MAG: FAD-dependent oxidoreductase [Actinobacteria bacterium]|nr:FAD-dependent oxidoreductase [Actinomycetota bacterium]
MQKNNPDAIVIGAGIVGACSALSLTNAGLKVMIIDRGSVASGTTGAGEGNILVSDKDPGPELTLALKSRDLWFELQEDVGDSFELEAKGGVVVARHDSSALMKLAEHQRAAGVTAERVNSAELHKLEPYLHPDLSEGVFYPQDAQCQPMLAAARIIQTVLARGGQLVSQARVTGFEISENSIKGVVTSRGTFHAPLVVNASGTWAGEIAALAGSQLPIAPRKGFILVTEPAPQYIFHKVYDSDYVANVASSDADLQTSTVVEGTRSGTILIGASRERIGFDGSMNYEIVRKLAAQATSLFPVLRDVQLLRVYRGFRPYAPDHLPVIGEDSLISGLWHSAGHEGAGIGLAPGSAALITDAILGRVSFMDAQAFSPQRFAGAL